MSTPPATTSYTVSQQTLNVLRQLVNAKGWAETLQEAYIGGKLVTKHLPELESTAWVKTGEQLAALSADERAAYLKRDEEWGAKLITFDLNAKQLEVVHKAFKYFVGELIKAKQLGAAPFLTEIVDIFGVELDDDEGDKSA